MSDFAKNMIHQDLAMAKNPKFYKHSVVSIMI